MTVSERERTMEMGLTKVIEATDIVVTFDGVSNVLDGVSLDCHEGELVVLVGRSGCGKTTLLNAVAGEVEISSGALRLLGGDPGSVRSQLGYMPARDALLPWRTAVRNVELTLEIHEDLSRKERRAKAREMLKRVGLGHAEAKYPGQLSQGMRQRVALARTWVAEPAVLLMDEPFAALDAQTRDHVRAEFEIQWTTTRPAVLFVTHDLTEAVELADRVVVLGDSGVIEEFVIDLPRPRSTMEMRQSVEFRDYEARLRKLLE